VAIAVTVMRPAKQQAEVESVESDIVPEAA
jgi:hypothetical protein